MALVRPTRLFTAAAVRELDRRAIEDHGIPGYTLMTRAASAALACLRLRWPAARRLAVYCGGGNNGGDGLVLARLAREAGLEVEVALAGDPGRLRGSAAQAWQDLGSEAARLDQLEPAAADVIVDALLGTGLDRVVEGPMATAIEAVNGAGRPVLAIDIPSGLHADSGAVLGHAVRAELTVGFIGAKRGLYTGAGLEHAGTALLDDLDVPAAVHAADDPAADLWSPEDLAACLPAREATAHKGDAGHVLVVGGAPGFAGAARLAGEAALRAGAGLVSVATMPAHAVALAAACPALMARGVEDAAAIDPLLERADVVAIGPGLGQADWGRGLLGAVLDRGDGRVLVDADGLNLLAAEPRHLDGRGLITPHPGEAARLLGSSVAEIQADRFAAAAALQERFGAAVLLKGPGTVVVAEDGQLGVAGAVEPALAAGGSGDVLSGVAAALWAQGADAATAGRGAALALLAAGRAAARQVGARSVGPQDLVSALGPVLAGRDG